jgi:hypothetical protein
MYAYETMEELRKIYFQQIKPFLYDGRITYEEGLRNIITKLELDLNEFRKEHIKGVKNVIVTGKSLLKNLDNGSLDTYLESFEAYLMQTRLPDDF